MTITNSQICTNDGWTIYEIQGSEPKPYRVLVQRPDDPDGVICSCKSFRYTGSCKHIEIALSMVCDWTEIDGPPQTDEQRKSKTCPLCGAPTQFVLEWNPN